METEANPVHPATSDTSSGTATAGGVPPTPKADGLVGEVEQFVGHAVQDVGHTVSDVASSVGKAVHDGVAQVSKLVGGVFDKK